MQRQTNVPWPLTGRLVLVKLYLPVVVGLTIEMEAVRLVVDNVVWVPLAWYKRNDWIPS